MSEFYPTTYVSFYTTHVPFDDYDDDPDFTEELVQSRIPMAIMQSSTAQYQPTDMRGTTVKTYAARIRGHYNVRLDYLIEDERTGERYSIDDMDRAHDPVGDSSWVMTIRKVPVTPGQ